LNLLNFLWVFFDSIHHSCDPITFHCLEEKPAS